MAVFSSPARRSLWESRWAERLGESVVGVYGGDDDDGRPAALAAQVAAEWASRLSGLVVWDEIHMLFGAELGEGLGLDWNPRSVIERCRDKHVMKRWLAEQGSIRVNRARVVRDAGEALAFQEEIDDWPVVVKPTEGAGSRNVFFAETEGQLLRYCQEVLEGETGAVLLEEFVGGPELAVNGLVDGEGGFLPTDVWLYDKRASHGVPNLYFQTIKLDSEHPAFWTLGHYAGAVVEALGLRRAPVHMEAKIDAQGPCIIEIAARFAGGNQPVLASHLHGVDLFDLAARGYLEGGALEASDVDFDRYDALAARIVSGVQPVALSRIRAVSGVAEVQRLGSFWGMNKIRNPGASLPQTRDLDTKSYEVYLMHPDPRRVEEDALAVRELVRYW